jgi:hypothetical protein
VLFGVVAPILALIFDPIVFRSSFGSSFPATLPHLRVFAYIAIPIGVLTLALWLWKRFRLGAWSGFVAGVLFAGALFAFLLGLVLLPVTLIGLFFIIGIFGLIPFATCTTFLRNAFEALNQAGKHLNLTGIVGSFLLGIIISAGIPALIQIGTSAYVNNAVEQIIDGDMPTAEAAFEQLKGVFWCELDCYTQLESAHFREADGTRRAYLEKVYFELTGYDIDWRTLYSD